MFLLLGFLQGIALSLELLRQLSLTLIFRQVCPHLVFQGGDIIIIITTIPQLLAGKDNLIFFT
jgi:hypothetical protein